jgi:hypothetical protein
MAPDDYQPELGMIRMVVKNVFEIHMYLQKIVAEAARNNQPVEVEALAKITNSLSLALTALNTTARTHALFSGTDTSLNDDFEEALNSLPVFLEDDYLREEDGREDEILVEEERKEILTGDEQR